MKTRWALVAILALGAGCVHDVGKHGEQADEGGEVEMTLDQVPAPVRATLNREAGGATIGTVDREQSHDGTTVYETDVTSGGKNREIRVDKDGRLLSKKVEDEEGTTKGDDDERAEEG